MEYRTYRLAELLPEALKHLSTLAGAAPGRPDDRPPQVLPLLRPPNRTQPTPRREKRPEGE